MSRDNRDIDRVQRRARRYWYDDGLSEIAAGCIFFLVGLLFLVEALAPAGSLPANFSAIGLPILLVVAIFVASRLVTAAKERLTYPRTGFVSYHRPKGARRIITGLVAGGMAALIAGLLSSLPASRAWTPALQGLLIGAVLLYWAHTLGITRFYALATLSALVGAAGSLSGLGETLGGGIYFSAMGLSLVVSGAITLRAHLTQSKPPAEG